MNFSSAYLFKQYYRVLCHYAWQYTADIELAKDVVQDVFESVHHRRKSLLHDKEELYIKNYLFLAVRNSCLNTQRKKKNEALYWEKTTFNEAEDNTVELMIMRSEVMERILVIVETLPESCRMIFKKSYIEGFSNLELAEELQISVNTIKTQKQRALKVLKSKLSPDLFLLVLYMLK